jgi:hypothetical protein
MSLRSTRHEVGNGAAPAEANAMDEVRVSSWAELQDQLYADSWQPAIGRFRSPCAFRGVARASYGLRTSLMRLGGAYDRKEGHLLRNFRKYAHRDAVREDSPWNWLALAQHHGLPTRLLDWTFSPFVALHIATEDMDHFGHDGVVWSVDYVRSNRHLPATLRNVLEAEGSDVFTVEMLDRVARNLQDLEALAPRPFVVFLEPPSLDDRIVNQFALFSLMSRPTTRLDTWLQRHHGLCRRVVIPASLKWEVRDKLDQANITERVLYPGLDGLSRWLKRYYSPGPVSPGSSDDRSGDLRRFTRRPPDDEGRAPSSGSAPGRSSDDPSAGEEPPEGSRRGHSRGGVRHPPHGDPSGD